MDSALHVLLIVLKFRTAFLEGNILEYKTVGSAVMRRNTLANCGIHCLMLLSIFGYFFEVWYRKLKLHCINICLWILLYMFYYLSRNSALIFWKKIVCEAQHSLTHCLKLQIFPTSKNRLLSYQILRKTMILPSTTF